MYRSLGRLGRIARCLKRREIVATFDELRRRAHRIDVETLWNVPRVFSLERADHGGVPDSVAVRFLARIESRMEGRRRKLDSRHAHAVGQAGVDGALQDAGFDGAFE